jgi:DNA-directed RNA polymerase I subunit RPA2
MNMLHWLENSQMHLSIQYRREIYYVPLMYVVKALTDSNDAIIFNRFVSARPDDSFWATCVKGMLIQAQADGVITQTQALAMFGSRFRILLNDRLGPWEDDEAAAKYLLSRCLLIHLKKDEDKMNCLVYMAQKLV